MMKYRVPIMNRAEALDSVILGARYLVQRWAGPSEIFRF